MTVHTAILAVRYWLTEVLKPHLPKSSRLRVYIITGWGSSLPEQEKHAMKLADIVGKVSKNYFERLARV